jgi:hypothetical protein
MFPGSRWVAVAAVALGLGSLPLVPQVLPVSASDVSATRLVERIQHSDEIGWSGEVRSLGSLQVPLTGPTFGGVSRLLGGQTSLRVWWRGPTTWRLDRMRATGETDLVRAGTRVLRWNYEDNTVNVTPYSPIRLPEDIDVVPSALAVRLLSGARASELARLPERRVAGHSAAGVRLVPADPRSTISRVDVWADVSSGLPLRVLVYGEPDHDVPVLTTEVVTLDLDRPRAALTGFDPSPNLDFSRGFALDQAAGANAFAPFAPPDQIAGLPRRGRPQDFGAVGVYGRGPTAVLALPLRGSTAEALHEQIAQSPAAVEAAASISLRVGPISVLLVDGDGAHFLLTGTVTPEALTAASIDLLRDVRRTE